MGHVYRKPEVTKKDGTAMNTATNEACIGWLFEKLVFDGRRNKNW